MREFVFVTTPTKLTSPKLRKCVLGSRMGDILVVKSDVLELERSNTIQSRKNLEWEPGFARSKCILV